MPLRVCLSLALLACLAGCTAKPADRDGPAPPSPSSRSAGDESRPTPRSAPGKGRRLALLVGVRAYSHKRLTDLKYTENDAEELAAALTKAGFDTIVVLTTSRGEKNDKLAPTRANIERELTDLLKAVTKHDLLLIALAGHGAQYRVRRDGKDGDESFFCPADARLASAEDEQDRDGLHKKLSATMLSFRDLFGRRDDSEPGTRLLLIDACRNDVGSRNADTDAMPRPTKGTAALFACKGGEKAHETDKLGKGHGVFFHHVIEGLKGKAVNKRGEVTWDRLTAHVRSEVPDAVDEHIGGGARQTPHLMANVEGDPVLVPGATKVVGPQPAEKDKEKKQAKDGKLYKVIAPIGKGIMRDDDDDISEDFFDKGDEVNVVDRTETAVKIAKGRKKGWLNLTDIDKYLEVVK